MDCACSADRAAAAALRSICPPEHLAACSVMADQKRRTLRWVGEQSFTRYLGQMLGGQDALTSRLWRYVGNDTVPRKLRQSLLTLAEHDPTLAHEKLQLVRRWALGMHPLLSPASAEWALLRTAARELHRLGAAEYDGSDKEQHRRRLSSCWAW